MESTSLYKASKELTATEIKVSKISTLLLLVEGLLYNWSYPLFPNIQAYLVLLSTGYKFVRTLSK